MYRRLIAPLACLLLATYSHCASAIDKAEVEALELQCEDAREVKLKPLREAEIAKCNATKTDRAPGYCERYWRNYGNSIKLPNGRMRPRMFDDLPECVAAQKARNELKDS